MPLLKGEMGNGRKGNCQDIRETCYNLLFRKKDDASLYKHNLRDCNCESVNDHWKNLFDLTIIIKETVTI